MKALVLLEVLAVLSCGSIGNIKISHQHCVASIASIALCHQYWSATVNNQGNPPTWQIPTLCSPKPHQYYPIVIAIEAIFPQSYKGRAKKSIQFTYGAFAQEPDGSYKYKFVKEKLLYNKTIFELNDIFGKDNTAANMTDESQRECVICFTTIKDTVVLPCRHLCLC